MSSPQTADLILEVTGLHKRFGERHVLNGIDLEVARGSVTTVLGPSGAGKSVLLKCIADVEQPESGEIRFDGSPSISATMPRGPFPQPLRFAFQGNALFDSLTALENVALP